jgi:aspartate ammonia-lyase
MLASDPVGSFAEITLPPVKGGSTQRPGNQNPVIPEMAHQVCFHVIGTDVTVGLAGGAGQLQQNPFGSLIAQCLITTTGHLERTTRLSTVRCVQGITANPAAGQARLESNAAVPV